MNDSSETPTWNGKKAVYSHVTHSVLGDHFEEGDELVVMFNDRAVVTRVEEVVTEEFEP